MDITTIKYPSHNELVQWYYQLAQKIADEAGVTPEQVNQMIEDYITEHPYPVVPADIITETNAGEYVVTSVNGERGDVTVSAGGDVPDNVLTTDNIGQNAVTSFNGTKGAVNYTAPVTSVNGMTGDVYTPIKRTSGQIWAFGIRTSSAQALIFARIQFTFEGIDVSYNATIPDGLKAKPKTILSWIPVGQSYSSACGAAINYDNRTIKVYLSGPASVTPPAKIWAGCVFFGEY